MPTELVHTTIVIDIENIYETQEVVVSEDVDGSGLVTVLCKTDYYGKLDFTMNLDMAEAVAKAMLEQVKFIKEKQ